MPLLPYSEGIESKIIINGEMVAQLKCTKPVAFQQDANPTLRDTNNFSLSDRRNTSDKLCLIKKENKIPYGFIY